MFSPLRGRAKGGDRNSAPEWVAIIPVPANSPPPAAGHPTRGRPATRFEYRSAVGELLGFVCRFEETGGGKVYLPLTWCRRRDGKGEEWRWKGFEPLRPLYGLNRLAGRPDATVVVCEGEKAADAAARLLPDHVAVTSPNGSKSASKADWTPLADRRVIVWPDADEAGGAYADAVCKALRQVGAASIARIAPPVEVKDGWDAADAEAEGWDQARALDLVAVAKPVDAEAGGGKGGRRRGPAVRDTLMELVEHLELWHTPEREAWATLGVNGHLENWPAKGEWFRDWLAGEYYQRYGTSPGETAITDAVGTIAAKARLGATHELHLRVGRAGSTIWLDLGDETWRAVRIDAKGWETVNKAGVKFRRVDAMRALPEPVPEGSIDELMPFVNCATFGERTLTVAWLVAAFNPNLSCPILALNGEQGSSKSTVSAVLRALTDPNAAPIRTAPAHDSDFVITAENSRVLAFDNMSEMPLWLSDALCRLSTGGGFSTRKKYSDRTEVVFQFKRAAIINGIPDLATRPDLADRCIFRTLPAIEEEKRQTEAAFWAAFYRARPSILGVLLDGVSSALRRLPEIRLERPPRMADFAAFATAAEQGLGWRDGEFMEAYALNRAGAVETAIESDPVAEALRTLLDAEPDLRLTATELLAKLEEQVPETVRKHKRWPAANRLRSRLRALQAPLRALGIDMNLTLPRESDRDRSRPIAIWKRGAAPK